MTAMIDTLKFAKSFELAGFAKAQAEALTSAMAEMNTSARDDLATKTDIHAVKSDISAARLEAKSDLQVAAAQLKSEITTTVSTAKWQILWMMFGSQLFVIASVAALSSFSRTLH